LWPDGRAIGRQLVVPRTSGIISGTDPYEVVGITGDVRSGARLSPDVFVPLSQAPTYWVDLVVRTDGDPLALREPLRRALLEMRRDLLIENMSSLDAIISDGAGLERAQSAMAGLVALLSALVAGVGLYALLVQVAAQRTRELGIRLALGCDPRRLFFWVFRRGMVLTGLGLGVGTAATIGSIQVLRHQVFGLAATRPGAFAIAATVIAIVSCAAAAAPARRVMQTDPLEAMRRD
jgi:predicted lysophospholipase L1 biosynthesis ABC-type transport system permease subunit